MNSADWSSAKVSIFIIHNKNKILYKSVEKSDCKESSKEVVSQFVASC